VSYISTYRNPDGTAIGAEPAQPGDGGCVGDLNGFHNAIGASGECAGVGAGWLSLSRLSASGVAAYRAIVWSGDDLAARFLAVDHEVGLEQLKLLLLCPSQCPTIALSANTPITPAATAASIQRRARN
jgi:hypothetical protein